MQQKLSEDDNVGILDWPRVIAELSLGDNIGILDWPRVIEELSLGEKFSSGFKQDKLFYAARLLGFVE